MVTVERSGSGKDPERLLELLWRHTRGGEAHGKPIPGRKPRLTLDRVVAAAVELADGEGLDGISMSRVAQALGVGTMTLYTYVPSKAELIDLMVDEVFAQRALPAPGEPRPDGWRAQLRLYADRTRAMYRRHPWLCHISAIRPPTGPGTLAETEYILSALFGIGLTPREMAEAAPAISTFVGTSASIETQSEELEHLTGQSNDDWWQERNQMWEEYFDVDRYPTMTHVWNHGGYDRGTAEATLTAHDFGFERLLDGIQSVIDLEKA